MICIPECGACLSEAIRKACESCNKTVCGPCQYAAYKIAPVGKPCEFHEGQFRELAAWIRFAREHPLPSLDRAEKVKL